MSKTVEQIKAARNELYDALPTGRVDSFDLIKLINEHIRKLDEITTPSPDVAGSDAVALINWIGKGDYTANGDKWYQWDGLEKRDVEYTTSQLYAKFRQEHPQPAGASVDQAGNDAAKYCFIIQH